MGPFPHAMITRGGDKEVVGGVSKSEHSALTNGVQYIRPSRRFEATKTIQVGLEIKERRKRRGEADGGKCETIF